ncbi:hypothetical protein BJ165DRAFT_1002348 [Panaeolus papilionaceus]|nr:hypothetical protein BJ165DRAFT_1002348 [Panaeolus papilionaceus]
MKSLSHIALVISILNVSSLTVAIPPQSYTTHTMTSTYSPVGCWDATLSYTSTAPTPVPTGPFAPTWSQCGGITYKGPTQCTPGNICFKYNEYYSQCIPDPSATTTTTTTRVTTPVTRTCPL